MAPNLRGASTAAAAAAQRTKGRHRRRHEPNHQEQQDDSIDNNNNNNNSGSSQTEAAASTNANTTTTSLEDYIPNYLAPWVHFYHGDFCYSRTFHPTLIAQLFAEGFLPIATAQGRILLPKLHAQRCVVPLRQASTAPTTHPSTPPPSSSSSLTPTHVGKSTRKKASRFRFTINQRFQQVVQGCRTQHGTHCWLYPSLVQAFQQIHQDPILVQLPATAAATTTTCAVQLLSIEVWDATTLQLVAGELGYAVGTMYTSLTGFSAADSAGSVQLAVLGRVLQAAGFHWWDLGMVMPYKQALGAITLARDDFVQAVHSCRTQRPHQTTWMEPFRTDIAETNDETHNCRKILDRIAGRRMDWTAS